MKKKLLVGIFSILSYFAVNAQCETSQQCNYLFLLSDSLGDGWNGNTFSVIQNGAVVATLGETFTEGFEPFTVSVPLCTETPFELFWNDGGSWANEVQLSITSPAGQNIFQLNSNNQFPGSNAYSGVGDCSIIACLSPFGLTAQNNGIDAYLSWSGTTPEYEVIILPIDADYPTADSQGVVVTEPNYLATDLAPNEYQYFVRSSCPEGVDSAWIGPFYFYTYCSQPSEITVSNINPQGATFTWGGTSENYEVYIAPFSDATITDMTSGIPVSGLSYTASGLQENVAYTIYVRSICSINAASFWIQTSFMPVTASVPLTTNGELYTPEQLITTVLMDNPCISISNVTSSTGTTYGSTNGIGFFNNSNPLFPLSSGIVLSTGDVSQIAGPNNLVLSAGSSEWPGDLELEAIVSDVLGQPMNSLNATVLEFDFVSSNEYMSFNFLFASDEYGTFQCSYADAFAFLLTDVETGVTSNLAVVPGTTTPVSVVTIRNELFNTACQSVNPGYFDAYFDPNFNNASPTNFNGQTEAMTASSALIPNHPYHIKLVVADRSDTAYDSAVFIQAGSFTSGPPQCSDKIELVAFIDENANGIKDLGENVFTYGAFSVDVNNAGATSIFSPFGTYNIYDSNAANSYDFIYLINPEYAPYYSLTGSSYADISIASGSGTQTFYFPVSLTNPYSDVTVAIVPVIPPRPGFTYTNQIVYTNLGVEPASGSLSYTKDALVSIVSAPAGSTATTDGFTFDFTNLNPYESRTLYVSMLIPESPVVEIDDELTSTASILAANDAIATNNNFTNTEIVVASYDPNTVTEAHGREIPIDTFTANDYLYYTIRFQNTGTAHAINVRVEQTLDGQVDAESLRLLGASHNYWMERIGNKLIWHFDYIYLPGILESQELSKGFAMFKVKLNPGFAVGDIVPSVAEIYFDNNTAVITNTFETVFTQALSVDSYTYDSIAMFPNPASHNITIRSTGNTKILNVSIADMLGKKIIGQKGNDSEVLNVDISQLSNGIYLVEILSGDKQKTVKKLIVE